MVLKAEAGSMKICTACSMTKPLCDFPKASKRPDGHYPACKDCKNAKARASYAADPSKFNEKGRVYYAAFPEHNREMRRKSREKNLQSTRDSRKAWRLANPAKVNSLTAEYRADKLQATPPWLSDSQRQEIESAYQMAKELQWLSEQPLHVDHIEPLRGKDVSGLHVPWNLQILPKPLNQKKSNRRAE